MRHVCLGWSSMTSIICAGVFALALGGCTIGSQQGYEPVQPVAYSHQVHAGKFQIDCLYCHYAAERGRHAGIPPISVCMNCHSQVKLDSPEIVKLQQAMDEGKPIAWVKVHRFPDHTFFDHARHVRDAGLRCQQCHGPIETMDRVRRAEPLNMGFCLDCHRQRMPGPSPTAVSLSRPRANAETTEPSPSHVETSPAALGPATDCSSCHH